MPRVLPKKRRRAKVYGKAHGGSGTIRSFALVRNVEGNLRALAQFAGDGQLAAMQFYQGFGDGQTKARAVGGGIGVCLTPFEGAGDLFQVFPGGRGQTAGG